MVDVQGRPGAGASLSDMVAAWEHADDNGLYWQQDRMHFADPMTALDFAYMAQAHDQLNWAMAHYGLPVRFHYRLLHHRWYYALAPAEADPVELHAMGERGGANVAAAVARLDTLWHDEWLPEIRWHLAALAGLDVATADLPTLVAHVEAAFARARRLWQIHFLQTMPVYVAMSEFEELCRGLFGDDSALGPYRLTQGLGNATFESGRALWQLSRRAAALPTVRRLLLDHPGAAAALAGLRATPTGRAFLVELMVYLNRWGKRGAQLGLSHPSWLEEPVAVLGQLADLLRRPDRNVEAEFAGQVEARERALAEARARLATYPVAVREQFEAALAAAQLATIVSEDHNHLIDYQSTYEVRRILLALGLRLVQAGRLDRADDVFHLSPDELRTVAAARPASDLPAVVVARRASLARAGAVVGPRELGRFPAAPPPADPVGRALGKFFGAPPPAAADPATLRGHAGSRGRTRGPARLVRSLTEAGKLRPGDIMVAPTTAPGWTPLFATLAAVVTDTGGVLSHCAVVAREYGLPAVVGTVDATERLRDGQLIEVDGDTGTVHLIE